MISLIITIISVIITIIISYNIYKQQQQRTSLSDKWLKWDKLNPTQLARSTKKNFQKNP